MDWDTHTCFFCLSYTLWHITQTALQAQVTFTNQCKPIKGLYRSVRQVTWVEECVQGLYGHKRCGNKQRPSGFSLIKKRNSNLASDWNIWNKHASIKQVTHYLTQSLKWPLPPHPSHHTALRPDPSHCFLPEKKMHVFVLKCHSLGFVYWHICCGIKGLAPPLTTRL